MSATRVCVLLAPGAEEMETVIIVDVLRRADVEVVLAGVEGPQPVRCSRGVTLVPDVGLDRVDGRFDFVVLPGGMEGTRRLGESERVGTLLRHQERERLGIGAICAAPAALARHGVGRGLALTCHPAVRGLVSSHGRLTEGTVVEDAHLVTSQGPGTAFEFSLALVARLCGPAEAEALRAPMLLDG